MLNAIRAVLAIVYSKPRDDLTEKLPVELLEIIAGYLDPVSAVALMQTNKKMYNIVRRTSLPSLRTFAPKIFKQAILDVSPNKLVGYLPSHKFIIERRLVKGTARIGYAFGKPCQRLGINIFRYGFWIEEYINFDTIIDRVNDDIEVLLRKKKSNRRKRLMSV